MRFVKMHGLGNDFVVVDALTERVGGEPAALARRICDRHLGIGADGLILILPPEERSGADIRMRIWNADGGEPEMCGNGIRCVCKLAYERGISRKNPMRIQTGRGTLALTYTVDGEGLVELVTVSMGEPILEAARIPVRIGNLAHVVDAPIGPAAWESVLGPEPWSEACGLDWRVTCVSMGNPHAVFWCRDVALVPVQAVGPILEGHPMFPNRANIHFAQVVGPGEVRMRTWERGAGMTLACGTGASAVCVAGALTGRTPRRVLAHLPGGDLDLEWSESDNQVRMSGPAVIVFAGEWRD